MTLSRQTMLGSIHLAVNSFLHLNHTNRSSLDGEHFATTTSVRFITIHKKTAKSMDLMQHVQKIVNWPDV